MAKHYNLMIIGSGSAARTAAMRVRAAGRTVAVIDFRPLGGTCALRGCDPKKVLVDAAAAVDHVRRMRDKGIAGEVRIDWKDLIGFKRSFTDPVPPENERRYAEKGIDTYHGQARFTGRNALEVDGESFEADQILIASGAEPVKLAIPGEELLITNEGFLAMETLPRRIALVGGGFIAAEFSNIAALAGAHVTVLQSGDRMLKQFDPDLVGWLMEKFAALGIDVRIRTRVEAVERKEQGFCVHAATEGRRVSVDADMVVHAAGRVPAIGALDLKAASVAVENGRLKLNEYLQSVSNPAVYAAGDAAQVGPPLTPVAGRDAIVVAANMLQGNHSKPDYTGVPSVAFSIPPIAAVGMSEAEARRKGLKIRVHCKKASDWFTARHAAESVYGFKVIVDEGTDHILGAHLVGPHADEVINLFALAIRHGITAKDLKENDIRLSDGRFGYWLYGVKGRLS